MIDIAVTVTSIDRIALALERLAQIQSAARFSFQLTFGGIMPTYKADKPDFDFNLVLGAVDSEGNVISDAPIPTGHTLTVTSDNAAAFAVTQDAADPKLVHAHVGGPNPDSTPSQANVTANLFDPVGTLVATGAAQVTVTVGDPASITNIAVNLPTA